MTFELTVRFRTCVSQATMSDQTAVLGHIAAQKNLKRVSYSHVCCSTVRYSSAKGRPAAHCLCHSSIGELAFTLRSDAARLSLISRQHCYHPPLTDVSHASQTTLTVRRRYAASSSGTACSRGCLPGSPDCYHLAQKCFSFLLATPVSMAEARMGLADCMSR